MAKVEETVWKCIETKVNELGCKIYDIEYGTTDSIDVTLPPPLFINVTNTNIELPIYVALSSAPRLLRTSIASYAFIVLPP